ncbi:Fibrinogen C domain-containing protein 1 [Holothuria leucospilota]|uniref:Fibrinogen C domain-containing protein 1 n=1 Tax=Holothuria leucospilota TaxID=206669 RepID=A0A9Q1H7A1_HOLLE|nr:Fibrinogen C domain-containing protein 1 [Holothuria leucospilota]
MENEAGRSFHVSYNLFRISDEWSDYMLVSLGQFSGTAGSFISWCPANMVYGNCTCQKTCEDPDGRNGCHDTCDEFEMCFCPEGFFIKGQQCVPAEECACFQPGDGVITSNGYSYNADCSRRCSCEAGVVTCEDNVMCDVNAVCEERDNIRQCYCNEEYLGDGNSCTGPMTDCQDVFNAGYTESTVYTIRPTHWPGSPFEVYCNMTGGRGWTVFQRRIDGSENFYQNWTTYRQGFGSLYNEFWLGNEKLYYLSRQKPYRLRMDMTLSDGTLYYLEYDSFSVGNESTKYQLTLGRASGNAGFDYMIHHRSKAFSTFDRDNDEHSTNNFAIRYHGGWWYKNCFQANLNGHYVSTMYLFHGYEHRYSCQLQYVQMKIRPV